MQLCPFCTTTWVDRACAAAEIRLTAPERRRLIAALLARPHLILSGPAGIGKRRLAHALALSMTQGRQSQVRTIQGHPWWAAQTGNIAHYVNLQTEFNTWRLADFLKFALHNRQPLSLRQAERDDAGDYVVCVERMSPVEIDLYFSKFLRWLLWMRQDAHRTVPLRLIGTYDSSIPPGLDHRILRVAALVHLGSAPQRDFR